HGLLSIEAERGWRPGAGDRPSNVGGWRQRTGPEMKKYWGNASGQGMALPHCRLSTIHIFLWRRAMPCGVICIRLIFALLAILSATFAAPDCGSCHRAETAAHAS